MDPSTEHRAFREPSDSPTPPGSVSSLHDRTLPIRREEFERLLDSIDKIKEDLNRINSADGWLHKKLEETNRKIDSVDGKTAQNTTEIISTKSMFSGAKSVAQLAAAIIVVLAGVIWHYLNSDIDKIEQIAVKLDEKAQITNQKLAILEDRAQQDQQLKSPQKK